jgi:hypothetical protein
LKQLQVPQISSGAVLLPLNSCISFGTVLRQDYPAVGPTLNRPDSLTLKMRLGPSPLGPSAHDNDSFIIIIAGPTNVKSSRSRRRPAHAQPLDDDDTMTAAAQRQDKSPRTLTFCILTGTLRAAARRRRSERPRRQPRPGAASPYHGDQDHVRVSLSRAGRRPPRPPPPPPSDAIEPPRPRRSSASPAPMTCCGQIMERIHPSILSFRCEPGGSSA